MRTLFLAPLACAIAFGACRPAQAVGRISDVQIVDQSTGETLTPVYARGEWWIAARPGARYGVLIANRSGGRVQNVVSVDGVNAVSGEDANWNQTGYVIDAYGRMRIDGWRKNQDQVAAFEFTELPNAYATRTGRPANVGVIGVAVFTERVRPAPVARPQLPLPPPVVPLPSIPSRRSMADDGEPLAPPMTQADSCSGPCGAPPVAAEAAKSASAPRRERDSGIAVSKSMERLGTGHGELQNSSVVYVNFERAQSSPAEIVRLHYDRVENLVAMGILPPRSASIPQVNPFPNQRQFVPDPPPRLD